MIIGENQKETTLTNLERNSPSLLPRGSILAKKSYLKTLADPAKIPHAGQTSRDGQNWKHKDQSN
jgi:hypothetical protein